MFSLINQSRENVCKIRRRISVFRTIYSYVVGGCDGTNALSRLEVYDPSTQGKLSCYQIFYFFYFAAVS